MKNGLLIISFLIIAVSSSAQPEYLNQLVKRYQIDNGFSSTVRIDIDVPGIVAPPKTVSVYAENGKKPKISGEGLVLLPKKGFIGQFSDILQVPVHWIFLESKNGFDKYKLVSLDPKSDWITADLLFQVSEPRIEEMNISTREAGEFFIKHDYKNHNYPSRSEISFETTRFNIPLKFMGKSDFSSLKDSTGKVSGKIILEFTEIEIF